MVTQSGISQITLYDALTTTWTQVAPTQVSGVTGDNIEVTNDQDPSFTAPVSKLNRTNYYDYTFSYFVFGLVRDLSQYQNKFGWLILLTFRDGTQRFLPTPSFLKGYELNTNQTNTYNVTLTPNRPTVKTMEVV